MSSNDQFIDEPTDGDDIAPPDPTAGLSGDGPNRGDSALSLSMEEDEGDGADQSTRR
jgi:hypothetical protein